MRRTDVIVEKNLYFISESYTAILSWQGLAGIQAKYKIFSGAEIEKFMIFLTDPKLYEKTDYENIIKAQYLETISLLKRDNINWGNIPIISKVTNYAIELKSQNPDLSFAITQTETDSPFEFFPKN